MLWWFGNYFYGLKPVFSSLPEGHLTTWWGPVFSREFLAVVETEGHNDWVGLCGSCVFTAGSLWICRKTQQPYGCLSGDLDALPQEMGSGSSAQIMWWRPKRPSQIRLNVNGSMYMARNENKIVPLEPKALSRWHYSQDSGSCHVANFVFQLLWIILPANYQLLLSQGPVFSPEKTTIFGATSSH